MNEDSVRHKRDGDQAKVDNPVQRQGQDDYNLKCACNAQHYYCVPRLFNWQALN